MTGYRGWAIWLDRTRTSCQWRASRHGVGLCANDVVSLKNMIDVKWMDNRA